MSLTKVFRCDDDGIYYVREIGNEVFWFGEHVEDWALFMVPTGRFANIFIGRRNGNEVVGRWYDVPKGRTANSGTLRLRIEGDDSRMVKIDGSGWFGGRVWREEALEGGIVPFRLIDAFSFRQAGFESENINDLTGTWMCNDGGTYYIRQMGDEVVWFGERRSFSNIFTGRIEGNTIRGRWVDVPKGRTMNAGELQLRIEAGNYKLTRTGRTGGFGGSEWDRVQSMNVNIVFENLTLHDTNDRHGDEPFLWTVFIKVDGDTVNFSSLRSSHGTVISNSGSHDNITPRNNWPAGSSFSIPDNVGKFSTILKTIRGLDPFNSLTRRNTKIGFVVVALDEDGTSDGAIEAGRLAMVSTIAENINGAIRSLSPLNINETREEVLRNVEDAIRSNTSWYDLKGRIDPDDMIGFAYRIFDFDGLTRAPGRIPLTLDFRGRGAYYQVTGYMQVDKGPVRPLED